MSTETTGTRVLATIQVSLDLKGDSTPTGRALAVELYRLAFKGSIEADLVPALLPGDDYSIAVDVTAEDL